jgi:hypothetical protein
MTGHSMPLQEARFLCSVQHSPPPHLLGCHDHYQVAVSTSNYRVNKYRENKIIKMVFCHMREIQQVYTLP